MMILNESLIKHFQLNVRLFHKPYNYVQVGTK